MLIVLQEYQLVLKAESDDPQFSQQTGVGSKPQSALKNTQSQQQLSQSIISNNNISSQAFQQKFQKISKLEVALQINDLQVISFDRFVLKSCPDIIYDEQVKVHLNFVMHYLMKKSLLEESKFQQMPQISKYLLQQIEQKYASPQNINRNQLQQQHQPYGQQRMNDSNRQFSGRYGNNNQLMNQNFNQRLKGRGDFSSDEEANQKQLIKEKLEREMLTNIVELKTKSPTEEEKVRVKKKKLRKLKKNVVYDGFLSCGSFGDFELIDNLEDDPYAVQVNALPVDPTLIQQQNLLQQTNNHATNHPQVIGSTQMQREEELDNIDEIMEDMIIEEDDEELNELEEQSKEDQSKDLMSQNKAMLLQSKIMQKDKQSQILSQGSIEKINTCSKEYLAELKEDRRLYEQEREQAIESLEQILGEPSQPPSNENSHSKNCQSKSSISYKTPHKQSKNNNSISLNSPVSDINKNEEILSNPSSVIENEKLQREIEQQKNQDRVELQFELTDEQKQVDQRLMFGSLPQGDLIGIGLNYSQHQRELRESKIQGQGGQNSAKKGQNLINSTQDDLLDLLDDRPLEEKAKDFIKFRKNLTKKKDDTKVTQEITKDGKKIQQSKLSFFLKDKREEKAQDKSDQKLSQSSLKTASEFKEYTEWSKDHEVEKTPTKELNKEVIVKQEIKETKKPIKIDLPPPSNLQPKQANPESKKETEKLVGKKRGRPASTKKYAK